MHRISLYLAILWDSEYSGLRELYETGWFEPDVDEEEQALDKEIEESLPKVPYWCEQIDGKVRIADFICDSFFRPSVTSGSEKLRKCARRTGEGPNCNALKMHALHLETLIHPEDGDPFLCFTCLRRVSVSHFFLEQYIGRRVLYCVQCLIKPRSQLLVAERTLENEHGIPRKLQRSQFRFHEFVLSVKPGRFQMPHIPINCRTGPIVVFKRALKGTRPGYHYYYHIGDIGRIKEQTGVESDELVSDDTRVKRVRKQPEVEEKIAQLGSLLKTHGFKISRLSITPISVPKRRKVNPLPAPVPDPIHQPPPTIAHIPNVLEPSLDIFPQIGSTSCVEAWPE